MRILAGHSAEVKAVAVTGDGKRAISASEDYTLKVWDLESGRALQTLEGHSGSVYAVAVTGDGKRAISGSSDKTLKVWDLESGRMIANYVFDEDISDCAIAGFNETIVAGGNSGGVHFLRLENWPIKVILEKQGGFLSRTGFITSGVGPSAYQNPSTEEGKLTIIRDIIAKQSNEGNALRSRAKPEWSNETGSRFLMGQEVKDIFCPECEKITKHRLEYWKPNHVFSIRDMGTILNMACRTIIDHLTSEKFNLMKKWTCQECNSQEYGG